LAGLAGSTTAFFAFFVVGTAAAAAVTALARHTVFAIATLWWATFFIHVGSLY
jgi:hypothetical protein